MSLKLMFLGKPNAGKGTYAKILTNLHNIQHISSGEIFREIKTTSPEFAAKMKPYDNKGELYPDNLTTDIVSARLEDLNSYILDGFPRTIPQAKMFNSIDKVILFNVDDDIARFRAQGRLTCQECETIYNEATVPPPGPYTCTCGTHLEKRDDDSKFEERLQVYKSKTQLLVPFYTEQNKLIEINANHNIEEVIKEITQKVNFV